MKHNRVMIVLMGAILITSCGQASKNKEQKSSKTDRQNQTTVFAVATTKAVKGQIRDYMALSGDIVASSTVDAYSDVAGKISKLFVSVGQRVQKDEPLAEVDPSRPGMTFNPGIVKAPITGTVVALPAQLGMTISQSVTVARLAGSGTLEVRTYVAERFISKMKVGLPVELTLDAFPGKVFYGQVRELSPTVDPASRTMEVRITVKNESNILKPGLFAKVKIITEEKTGVVKIPATAIVRRYGEQYVFTVETDPQDPARTIAKKRVVTAGILIDDQVEIRNGIEAGAEVVLRGQSLLEDGVQVRVVDTTAPLKTTY